MQEQKVKQIVDNLWFKKQIMPSQTTTILLKCSMVDVPALNHVKHKSYYDVSNFFVYIRYVYRNCHIFSGRNYKISVAQKISAASKNLRETREMQVSRLVRCQKKTCIITIHIYIL